MHTHITHIKCTFKIQYNGDVYKCCFLRYYFKRILIKVINTRLWWITICQIELDSYDLEFDTLRYSIYVGWYIMQSLKT